MSAHREAGFDLELEVGARLMMMIDELPKPQRRRFRPAARRAASALEESCPGLMAMTPEGMLAGLYSAIVPGRLLIVVASATKCLAFTPELRALPQARDEAQAFLDESGKAAADGSKVIPMLLAGVLEAGALSPAWLGFLLLAPEHRAQVELFAANGATPALVALLSDDRTGSLRLTLPHGRAWPALELEEPSGHA
jgi:hypothetical protein